MTPGPPMKIGMIRQRYVASGGAERYLQAVAKELSDRGHEVHLFANSWSAPDTATFAFHRVPMVRASSFLKAMTFARWSAKVVRRANCEIVFSLERTVQQDVYRAGDGCHREWLEQRKRFVRGSNMDRFNPFHATMLRLERQTFCPACTGWIIANSRRGKEEIVRHY